MKILYYKNVYNYYFNIFPINFYLHFNNPFSFCTLLKINILMDLLAFKTFISRELKLITKYVEDEIQIPSSKHLYGDQHIGLKFGAKIFLRSMYTSDFLDFFRKNQLELVMEQNEKFEKLRIADDVSYSPDDIQSFSFPLGDDEDDGETNDIQFKQFFPFPSILFFDENFQFLNIYLIL